MYAPLIDDDDCPISGKIEPIRPTEILCHILQYVVGSDGVKALLPSTHVSISWRRAALGDSSLWTTIYLSQTPPPLLDMILARAGNQLFTIHADHGDFERYASLWVLVRRFEEFHYSAELGDLAPFLASLGPAPNLKVLRLRPESYQQVIDERMTRNTIPTIFSGCLPSLRHLSLPKTVVWPAGLFKGLTSLECGTISSFPVFPSFIFDALRGSPLIESLHVVGCCLPVKGLNILPVHLSSLKKCTLIGEGIAPMIRFIIVPPTALISLGKPYVSDWTTFPHFSELSVAPGLRAIGEISSISFSINNCAARLQARNDHGGVLDVVVDGLNDLSRDPSTFVLFIQSSFECWDACPGLRTAKELTLLVDRDRVWNEEEAMPFALALARLVSNLSGIEGAKLYGVSPAELGTILGLLIRAQPFELECPNLKRLDIAPSANITSPSSLLMVLGNIFEVRKEAGAPFESVTVKLKCEKPVPVVFHCGFLAACEGLVGGGVRLEYERAKVKTLPTGRRRTHPEDGAAGTGDSGDDVAWDGWPENWPKTLEEMRGG